MIAFTLLGAWGLAQLNKGRYDAREKEQRKIEAADTRKEREPFDLEREYERMRAEIDVEKWEPMRVPRP